MKDFNTIKSIKDMKTLNMLKEEFDKAIDAQREVIALNEKAEELSNKSFNFIKENFEALSSELFKTKNGRNIIAKYVTCIKENKDLGKVHILSECIRKAEKDVDATSYINEAMSMIGNVSKTDYNVSVKKLGKILGEAYKYLGGKCTLVEENEKLDEAINYLAAHKKTALTLPKYTSHVNVIKEHIKNNGKDTITESNKINIEKAVNEFNEKYGESLDEGTKSIIKELTEATNKENVFNKYKALCTEKLKTMKESTSDASANERLSIILEKVNSKVFNIETANHDVYSMNEIINSLEK